MAAEKKNIKVKVIKNYIDKVLKRKVKAGEDLIVTSSRAKALIAARVAVYTTTPGEDDSEE